MFHQLYRRVRPLLNWFVVSALPPASCRFTPTCSVYCSEVYQKYGFLKGSLKCVTRILRCHPFSKGGFDPA